MTGSGKLVLGVPERDDEQHQAEKRENGHDLPPIRQISVVELKALLESETTYALVDVRTHAERAIATIEGSRLLDQACHDSLLECDRETLIIFQCHHGIRSQHAAEYFRQQGFRNLCNVQGGIEAWSRLIDPAVPRY